MNGSAWQLNIFSVLYKFALCIYFPIWNTGRGLKLHMVISNLFGISIMGIVRFIRFVKKIVMIMEENEGMGLKG